MNENITLLYNEIKDKTNRYNRTPRNKWFSEKFEALKSMLSFEIDKFSEIEFIVTNDLTEYPTCSSCGGRVKKVDKQFCSVKCRANDPKQMKARIKTFKKTIEENPEIIKARSKKWKHTVANKTAEEMLIWANKMSISRKESEANLSLEKRKQRSQKLSIALKKYNYSLSEEERKITNEKIQQSKNNPISKQLAIDNYKNTYELYKNEINNKKMETRKKNGNIAITNTDFKLYSKLVRFFSEKEYQCYKDFINPNNNIRGKYTDQNLYHVDHIISIKYGFDNNIPVYIISSYYNLTMLLVEDNCKKGSTCGIELEELFTNFF